MPTLFQDLTIDYLVSQTRSELDYYQQLCAKIVADWVNATYTQLSETSTVTIPRVNAHVLQRLRLDELTVGGIVLPALLAFVLTGALLTCILDPFRRIRAVGNNSSLQQRPSLYALITVLAPANSRWPAYYLDAAYYSISKHKTHIRLSLSHVWEDILAGTVELRAPETTLPDVLVDRLCVYGWKISIEVDRLWILGYVARMVITRMAGILPQKRPAQFPTAMSRSVLGFPPLSDFIPYPYPPTSERAVLMLDDIPYGSLSAYIRTLQESLTPDTSAILGFSAMVSSARPSYSQLVFASMPFVPRRYIQKMVTKTTVDIPHSARRTLTPTLTSLDTILQLVSSGPRPLTIESVQNVSEQYTGNLQDYVDNLTHRPHVRNVFVAQWGMSGWREERLMGQWEAALFSAGILARWLVVIRK